MSSWRPVLRWLAFHIALFWWVLHTQGGYDSGGCRSLIYAWQISKVYYFKRFCQSLTNNELSLNSNPFGLKYNCIPHVPLPVECLLVCWDAPFAIICSVESDEWDSLVSELQRRPMRGTFLHCNLSVQSQSTFGRWCFVVQYRRCVKIGDLYQ